MLARLPGDLSTFFWIEASHIGIVDLSIKHSGILRLKLEHKNWILNNE